MTESESLKILHLITRLTGGGAQENTLLTVDGLRRLRYQVHLASSPEGRWLARGARCADRLHLIPAMRQDRGQIDLPSDLRAFLQILKLLRRERFTIVHTHSSKAGLLGRAAARLTGLPIVVHTIHGFPFNDYMSSARRSLYIGLERFASRLADRLITVCDANREEAINLSLAPAHKLITVPSGVDLDRLDVACDRAAKRRSLGLDPDRPVVGMIARLRQQKAPRDFVEAARLVLEHVPEVQFIIVGDGPLEDQIAAMIENEPRIRLLGYRDDVPEILQTLDVFALSSLWEGLGRALTEAMAMRVPVAVTAVNGVPEIVIPHETGLLSPPRDPHLLAENIVYLLQHPDEARRYAENGRQRVVPGLSAQRMVEGVSQLYAELIQEKGL